MIRTSIAFLVSPLVLAAVIIGLAGPWLAGFYAYSLSFLFGMPLFFVLKWKKKESYFCYAVGGTASATLVGLVIISQSGAPVIDMILVSMFSAGIIGALEGLCFRAIRGQKTTQSKTGTASSVS